MSGEDFDNGSVNHFLAEFKSKHKKDIVRTRGLSVASVLLLSLLSALSLPEPRPVLRLIPSMKESTSDLKN